MQEGTLGYLLLLCGTGFALCAAVTRASSDPSDATGALLMLAGLVLCAQAMGPLILDEMFRLSATTDQFVLPGAMIVAGAGYVAFALWARKPARD